MIRQTLLRWWQSELGTGRSVIFSRHQLLAVCMFIVGANALVFYFLPYAGYDRRSNLVAAIVLWCMMPWAFSRRLYPYLVNGALLVVLTLLVTIALQTGGIQSPTLVWSTLLAVPALFFLGPKGSLLWIGVIFCMNLALLLNNLRDGSVVQPPPGAWLVLWAVSNHVLAAGSLVLVLSLYDRLHKAQLQELDLRNRELENTQTSLLQAQTHKDEFVAAVGHELRTPMNAILGLNGLLREELADDPAQVETVEHIRRSTQHLLHVVNDILDFAQLQAGRVGFFPDTCDLAPWLENTVAAYRTRAQAKGLVWQQHLAPDVPKVIWVDRQRLAQILGYLLDNALKFTATGTLSLRLSQRDHHLRVEVQDTGRGIARERHEQIFNRFESADVATNQAFGGTGLGLTICERLVVLQGGRIGVQSVPGQGALFWLELPLQQSAVPTQEVLSTPPALAAETAFDVLLVDDNAMNLMVAQLQLRNAWPRVRVTTADTGQRALDLLLTQHFDVVLLDMVMPDMDGLEVTRRLRALPAPMRHLPVVALTANTNPLDRQRCLDAGMNQVLYKPMDPQALVATLTDALSHRAFESGQP
ncbi:MAG: ATP-binding protein [Pseudomonadota bacterium]|jgi:signal transduction histidine kinase/ActR/RegA family two-component response regulator